ncbi:FecR domain-containing protein [Posidoniimonas polymericola]|uniref:FecR domain-containing protein n=1 Tax=Posidoniimonas polymericola TaxID=2528002 RepID=UPI0018D3FC58|nr:FecR family protein [Posidoniimonas polymericola]
MQRLLGASRAARSYFVQMLQVEAELEWRYASADQVAQSLTKRSDGSEYPAASIVASQMGYRVDSGFAAVFGRLADSEESAQLWLRLYPLVRATLFACLPTGSDAEACVEELCTRLVDGKVKLATPETLIRETIEAACESIERQANQSSVAAKKAYSRLVRVLLGTGVDLDVVALYDAFDNVIPRMLPAEDLRLLCRRYLLEQSPVDVAESQQLPLADVYKRLANARVQVLTRCAVPPRKPEASGEVRALSLLNLLIDRRLTSEPSSRGQLSRAEAVNGLSEWAAQDDQHREYVLAFALLHEAFNRNLSLHRLLDESKSQSSADYHQVLAEMVHEFEDEPASTIPGLTLRDKPAINRRTVSWLVAVAAAVLLAVGLVRWQTPRPTEQDAPGPALAAREAAAPEAREPNETPTKEELAAPEPVVVASITTALDVANTDVNAPTPYAELPIAGADIHEGQRLQFDQGVVRVLAMTQCEWVLEGPVAVVFHSAERVELERGKIVGHNRSGGRPLVVQAPNAQVEDLGTEFGVSVDNDLATRVAVYEGSVAMTAGTEEKSLSEARPLQIEAQEQAEVTSNGAVPSAATPLQHDREFIRSDELDLRVEEKAGSSEAAKQVAFYELLRTNGLLAYQGFDSENAAQEFSIGFCRPAIRHSDEPQFTGVRRLPDQELLASDELEIPSGGCYFIDLDTSPEGRLARQGLLDAANKLGPRACELWLHWRTKAAVADGKQFDWMGVSLMSGDRRNIDEPLFVGQPNDLDALGVHSFGRDEFRFALDFDQQSPGVQDLKPDDQWHTWALRIRCHGEGSADVDVWCDVPLAELDAVPPQAKSHFDQLQFDRFRVEVSESGATGAGVFDEFIMTSSLGALHASVSNSIELSQK